MASFHARVRMSHLMPSGTRLYTVVEAADEAEAATAFHSVFHGIDPGDVTILPSPLAPTGTLVPYAGSTAPSGWLLADGSAVSRTDYSSLFEIIGETYGAGDGSTTFNLPDHTKTTEVNQRATAPSFGTAVTVPTDALTRRVYGTFDIQSGSTSASRIDIERETSAGSGVYEVIMQERVPNALSGTQRRSFSFFAESGVSYRFVEAETGGSRSILDYSYDDVYHVPADFNATTIIKT